MFESEASIRCMIARGELRKGIHYFQEKHRGRIRLDLDAIVEMFTQPKVETLDRIPVIRGGFIRDAEKAGAVRGLYRS
jgi:hypothetical protein